MLFFYSFFDKSFFSWFVRVMDLYSILNMGELGSTVHTSSSLKILISTAANHREISMADTSNSVVMTRPSVVFSFISFILDEQNKYFFI